MSIKIHRLSLALGAVLALSSTTDAAPLLQLDIAGGVYDTSTRTITATANPFTLYALLTPDAGDNLQKRLDKTYYISAAISPQISEGRDLGSFSWNGTQVDVTDDMTYGKPPLERFSALQGHDSQDLGNHEGLYPTYFTEFAFTFSSLTRVETYDTSVDRSGPVASPTGGSYLAAFSVDTSLLNPNFVVHFDLYDEIVRSCGVGELAATNDPACSDIDVRNFAPFANDAQSPPVPEPASMLLLAAGTGVGALRRRWRR